MDGEGGGAGESGAVEYPLLDWLAARRSLFERLAARPLWLAASVAALPQTALSRVAPLQPFTPRIPLSPPRAGMPNPPGVQREATQTAGEVMAQDVVWWRRLSPGLGWLARRRALGEPEAPSAGLDTVDAERDLPTAPATTGWPTSADFTDGPRPVVASAVDQAVQVDAGWPGA
ncbi:MAG: hypothetical protein ACRDI2_18925, partial [Chloroflexota bacterium]